MRLKDLSVIAEIIVAMAFVYLIIKLITV